jgi:hypothetical protein
MIKVQQFPAGGLRLIAPSSPEFRVVLRSLQHPAETAALENSGLLPFSVLIANDGGNEFAAATILFKGTSTTGETTTRQQTFYSLDKTDPPSLFLTRGQTRLLTPSSDVNADLLTNQHRIADISVTRDLEWCSNQGEIEVSVDATIDIQGEIVGPDRAHMQEHLNAQLAAIQDLASKLLSHYTASVENAKKPQGPLGTPIEDVGAWLGELATTNLSKQLELSPKLRQTVKTHFSLNGELSHGNVSTKVYEGV